MKIIGCDLHTRYQTMPQGSRPFLGGNLGHRLACADPGQCQKPTRTWGTRQEGPGAASLLETVISFPIVTPITAFDVKGGLRSNFHEKDTHSNSVVL